MLKSLFSKDNITILIKALALSLFFSGSGQIFGLLFPKKNWTSSLLMVGIAVTVLMMDDGNLSELYKLKKSQVAAAHRRVNEAV